MAQLIQCDFCGNITNQIAARIDISFNPEYRRQNRMIQTPSGTLNINEYMVQNPSLNSNSITKDCCDSCVAKFLDVKPVPLAITPSGEAVKSEDL